MCNYNLHLRNTLSSILHKPKLRNTEICQITQKRQMFQIYLNNFRVKVWMIYYVWKTCWMSKNFFRFLDLYKSFQNVFNEPNNIFSSNVNTKKQLNFLRNSTAGNFRTTIAMAICFYDFVNFNKSFLKCDWETSYHL